LGALSPRGGPAFTVQEADTLEPFALTSDLRALMVLPAAGAMI
jgi:hypothetical protein